MSEHQKTVVVDFDNTLAGYDKWRGEKVLGPPILYARDALNEYREWGWRIVVFTTRGDAASIRLWLQANAFPQCEINSTAHNPPNCSQKPIGEVYHDDRDAHVVGCLPYNWHRAMKRVRKKYQPPLDTHVDDAAAWSGWFERWFIAPFVRIWFRSNLKTALTVLEIVTNDNLTDDQKFGMIRSAYELDVD